ncbi:3'(2'),5'-bisphosphate nucleotidase CysQ [Candidatus Phycosocius spiralis]|uniref:3'(2'),5'-bisphosphate nucleotidase CysQ n=1 Tax=Candidatus Phycosocius spiralis TaxID=2815099 RepID=A0ABQ4PW43_9PROT|nr:3'(2'),5'-bisphosphate nucleotidase CysQ [Candidatus Phycosocius spiralis]GIU67212.1 3'(2'),5'-bisphosphate nucleotidase CysQ [Candidatus Phycosocius spiralis]
MDVSKDDLILALEVLCRRAGKAILDVKAQGVHAHFKPDGSPVTQADLAANAVLLQGLERQLPDWPCISEEMEGIPQALKDPHQDFILIDPLDGTREFIDHGGDYTVNVALIRQRRPILGVVHMPETGLSWIGDCRSEHPKAWQVSADGAWQLVRVRKSKAALTVLLSRSHGDPETKAFLSMLNLGASIMRGSSLKFCLIARGDGDLYPRFGPTMEWDIAAGDAVLNAAGGQVLGLDAKLFLYGQFEKAFKNSGFLALGDPAIARRLF